MAALSSNRASYLPLAIYNNNNKKQYYAVQSHWYFGLKRAQSRAITVTWF
jgi:hypothetical protein